MWQSIFYKEWLKIRKIALLLLAIGILIVIGIHLSLRHDLILSNSNTFWNRIINKNYIYFSLFKFVPLLIGLLIGIAQFIPEVIDKRIKLTLHLPLDEDTVILKMVAPGAAVVVAIFLILFLLLYGIGLIYFPVQIINMTALTVIPWFFAGIAAYLLVSFIILEPKWRYRIFYLLFAAGFIQLFFKGSGAGAYSSILLPLAILIALCSISTVFSIYRFRKGIM